MSEILMKILSHDLIKPSSLTPSHKKNLTLSYVDQIVPLPPLFSTCGILFYTTTTSQTQPLTIANLKASLSKTLAKFYPIAGRVSQSCINCNDEGIPFIEAHVNCPISNVLKYSTDRKLDLMPMFLPPHESLGIASDGAVKEDLIHLAIQVSVFTCGGVAIGWYDIHKVMDGMSSASFFKTWAALATERSDDGSVVEPDFDSAVTAFPPSATYQPIPIPKELKGNLDILGSPPVVKRFVFKNTAITKLKTQAASEKVPKPSRFMTVAGFIWEQALKVTTEQDNKGLNDSILQVTLDMRSRMSPPLGKSSMGNLATIAIAKAEKQGKLPDFVAEIDTAVSRLNDEIREYQGEKGVEGIQGNWNKLVEISSIYKEKAYKLVSWCRLGFNDLDFGFGKPSLVIPTDGKISPLQRNVIILMDYSDSDGDGDDGIEAWLFLDHNEMKLLEVKQEFLDFADLLR